MRRCLIESCCIVLDVRVPTEVLLALCSNSGAQIKFAISELQVLLRRKEQNIFSFLNAQKKKEKFALENPKGKGKNLNEEANVDRLFGEQQSNGLSCSNHPSWTLRDRLVVCWRRRSLGRRVNPWPSQGNNTIRTLTGMESRRQ
jgi:hypothetical protein